MKKLFISCPMKGRTEENIKKSREKMHKIAEIAFEQPLEVIESYVEETTPETVNAGIWYLGESVKKLAEADFYIGIRDAYDWNGCYIENEIAQRYGIRSIHISTPEFMPDAVEVLRNQENCVREPVI